MNWPLPGSDRLLVRMWGKLMDWEEAQTRMSERLRLFTLTLLGVFLFSACGPSVTTTISLVEELPNSQPLELRTHSGTLADVASNRFLTGPWGAPLPDGSIVPLNERYSGVRFFLPEPMPLELVLEGGHYRSSSTMMANLKLNEHLLPAVPLSRQLSTQVLTIPPDQLQIGENLVHLPANQTHWKRVQVRPLLPGLAFEEKRDLAHSSSGEDLLLVHSRPLEFDLELGGAAPVFRLDKVLEWLEPGAPEHPQSPVLTVRLRSEEPQFEKILRLETGQGARVALPDSISRISVTLASLPGLAPERGQLGLRLTHPRLEFSPQPKATTTPTSESTPPPTQATSRPNLVIYLIDTLRADHLSCYGYERSTSPHIDALAKDGFRFENVSAQSPWTKPSTATIFSGLHPKSHGAMDWADKLPSKVETLAERLSGQGYQSLAFVTNGFASSTFNMTQGFEEHGMLEATSAQVHKAVVDWFGSRNGKQPFFLYVHTMDPHTPYHPPEEFNRWSPTDISLNLSDLDRANTFLGAPPLLNTAKALYDGEIAANDHSFGLLVEELKQRGLYDNTVILVISDHGEEFYEHQSFGHARTLYEEVIRVPWVMKYPAQLGAGTVVKGEWQHLDVVPTVLGALGLEIPSELEGLALDPRAPQSPLTRSLYLHVYVGPDAVELEQQESALVHLEGIRRDGWSYLTSYSQVRPAMAPETLFDLKSDPLQHKNLLYQQRTTASVMRDKLKSAGKIETLATPAKASSDEVEEFFRKLQYLR